MPFNKIDKKEIKIEEEKIEYKFPSPSFLELVLQDENKTLYPDDIMLKDYSICLSLGFDGYGDVVGSYKIISGLRTKKQAEEEYKKYLKILNSGNYKIIIYWDENKAEILSVRE